MGFSPPFGIFGDLDNLRKDTTFFLLKIAPLCNRTGINFSRYYIQWDRRNTVLAPDGLVCSKRSSFKPGLLLLRMMANLVILLFKGQGGG